MAAGRVCLAYNDPDHVWTFIHGGLSVRLQNMSFAVRTASGAQPLPRKVGVACLPHDHGTWPPYPFPQNWYRNPFAQLYILKCEDLSSYRRRAGPALKTWVAERRDSRNWLIVYVPMYSKGKGGKVHKKIFDRICTEFYNNREGDRSIRIEVAKDSTTAQWDRLAGMVKGAVERTFFARAAQYDAEISKLRKQETLPGWNYCFFFIVRESYAYLLEGFRLVAEARAGQAEARKRWSWS